MGSGCDQVCCRPPAETIPRGRVQGVRMVEPWLWRPFGWCRLVVDVAGKQRAGRESRSISEALRTVLPVGSKEQAAWLLERILPGVPARRSPPPPRARWKSPLRYRYLSWGGDRSYAVTTSGRIRRVTDWVPLAKVQSIRLVEGPLQRRLRLATVHLDTAGRSIHAALRDRDRAECDELLSTLPGLCRMARAESAARARVREHWQAARRWRQQGRERERVRTLVPVQVRRPADRPPGPAGPAAAWISRPLPAHGKPPRHCCRPGPGRRPRNSWRDTRAIPAARGAPPPPGPRRRRRRRAPSARSAATKARCDSRNPSPVACGPNQKSGLGGTP